MDESEFKKFLVEELTKFKNESNFEKKKALIDGADKVLFDKFVIPNRDDFEDEVLDSWKGTLMQIHDYGIEEVITEQEILDMLEDLKQDTVNWDRIGKYWKVIYD